LGLLFGQHEDFLWKTSLIWKIMNACFFSFWGYYLDKFGIKKILMTVLVAEIINNSMCYFLLQNKIGYIVSTGLSAIINSCYLGITPTCYALIFGDEKGILLYSISSILINTFYICRPIINHIANDKVYTTVDLYMTGIYTKEQALQQLIFQKPNNQICIANQDVLDRHLHFVESIVL
jgi:MFS family permease